MDKLPLICKNDVEMVGQFTHTPLGNTIVLSFFDGAKVEVQGEISAKYHVVFHDTESGLNIYEADIEPGQWSAPNLKYMVKWRVVVFENNDLVFDHTMNFQGKKVLVCLNSIALGDTLAWFPYVEEFRKLHGCEMYVGTFWNQLFDKSAYPDLHFVTPGENDSAGYYAMYRVGVFDNNYSRNKCHWRLIGLQQVASDMLNLKYREIRPRILIPDGPRPIEEKYVAISEFSTIYSKFWLNPDGWQGLVNLLNDLGYKVVSVSKEPTRLKNVIAKNGVSIEETIRNIKHSEFFVGVSSGLSWVSWAMEVPTVIISGFSAPIAEMQDCVRIHNPNVCNGCMNDKELPFDRGDWRWCPRNGHFVCSTSITLSMVKEKIRPLLMGKRPPRFSIIMPTKNRPQMIRGAINSILEQDFEDWELIIKDAGESVWHQIPKDPRIKYEHCPGGTLVDDFNRGMWEAKGEIINLASDDDYMGHGALRYIHETIGDAKWIYGRILRNISKRVQGEEWNAQRFAQLNIVPTPATFWTRFARDIAGSWNREFTCADYDYWHRLAGLWEPKFTEKILVAYTEHDGQDTKAREAGIRKDEIEIPKRVKNGFYLRPKNRVMQGKREIEMAQALLTERGWKHHPCAAKDWDLMMVLPSVDPRGDILDMGCANSGILPALKDKGYGRTLSGIDLSKNDYTVGDLCHTPFNSESFDTITCLSVIEHNVDFKDFLKEAWRLLRPGGKLLVTFDYWHDELPEGKETHPLCRFDVDGLISYADKQGFKMDGPFDYRQGEAAIKPGYFSVDLAYTFAEIEFIKPALPKTLFIAPHLSTGGMPQYLLQLVKEMKKDRNHVAVVEWNNVSPVHVVQKNKLKEICQIFTLNGGSKRDELKEVLDSFKPDVVHLQEFPEMFVDFESLQMLYRENRPYKIHETGHSTRLLPDQKRILPDRFVFVGDWHAKNFGERFGVPFSIKRYEFQGKERPNREEALREMNLNPEKRHVVQVGLFAPWKDQRTSFQIARLLPDIEFHFVGSQAPNFESYWKPLMEAKPENCRCWGECADVDRFYRAMDLLLFPSTEECSPLVPKEALAWGMPVLMRRLDACAEEFEGKVTFMEGDIKEFVAQVEMLIRQPILE